MNFRFHLPESFHPGEFLRTPKLNLLTDDARYFVSLILTKTARRQVDESGYVRLMAKHLRSIMHTHHYNRVVDALLDSDVVERVPYQVGERAFGYRLAERFRNDKHVRVVARDSRLITRLRSFHDRAEHEWKSRMKPVHFALERHQKQLTINGEQAREIVESLPPESNPWDIQGVLVRDIEEQDFRVNVGRYGRLSNNVTSMKREIRQALSLHSEPLQHVDISCCQPALIGKIARERAKEHYSTTGKRNQPGSHNQQVSIYDAPVSPPKGGDLGFYCELVQSGRFYEFLISEVGDGTGPILTREDLKKRFLADVIAKRKANQHGTEYPSAVEDTFRKLFPTVYQFIREVNNDGFEHANLIRRLQQEESKLVIETVAAELVTKHRDVPIMTLHDAIFTTASGIPVVVGAFEAAFVRIDFPMTLKVAR